MNHETIRSDQLGAFLSGMLDVIFGFTIVLERRGLLTRAEIAAALREMRAQIEAQEGPDTARNAVVDLMLTAFDLPIAGVDARSRFQLIAGGKPAAADPNSGNDEPPPGAA